MAPFLYGASSAPVSLNVATYNEYLVLVMQNEPGWHTYYKDPGEVGLPFSFAFSRHNEPMAIRLAGWPRPDSFTDPSGFSSKGYTGKYAFFFSLPSTSPPLQEGELLHVSVKWLACGDRCIPQKIAFDVSWQQGRWVPAEKIRESVVSVEAATQLFSALEPNTVELLEIPSKRKIPWARVAWMFCIGMAGIGIGWRRFRLPSKQ